MPIRKILVVDEAILIDEALRTEQMRFAETVQAMLAEQQIGSAKIEVQTHRQQGCAHHRADRLVHRHALMHQADGVAFGDDTEWALLPIHHHQRRYAACSHGTHRAFNRLIGRYHQYLSTHQIDECQMINRSHGCSLLSVEQGSPLPAPINRRHASRMLR